MHVLETKIATIIADRNHFPFFSLATLLYAGALIYSAVIYLRNALYASGIIKIFRIDKPVISIGNLTTGGTGKTPMTIHLAKLLRTFDKKVLIVSRGYKGAAERCGIVVSDGHSVLCNASLSGDEPQLMARLLPGVPVVVGKNRYAAACKGLRHFAPDVILLDDAFQHQRLARDLNLLLLDAQEPVGNGYLLPRGPMREPISAVRRADAILFTRCASQRDNETAADPVFNTRHIPVVRCHVPVGVSLDSNLLSREPEGSTDMLYGRPVIAFAGLAHNDLFWQTVTAMGATVQGAIGFADHHKFHETDLDKILQAARMNGCQTLVTTDKDYVRLPAMSLPVDLIVIGIEIDFGGQYDRWRSFIADKVNQSALLK